MPEFQAGTPWVAGHPAPHRRPPPAALKPLPGATSLLTWLIVATVAVAGSGCAAFRSYKAEMDKTIALASGGDVNGAIKVLESNNKSKDKDLLYDMELGELRRLNRDFQASQAALKAADAKVQAWEEASKLDAARTGGSVGSYLLNDKVRTYEGFDYEKVMITTLMAMNSMDLGDWDTARIDIKRTHEREAVIQALRADEYLKVAEEAKKKGARQSFKELNGYPVQTIDTPEVNALRNGYQNALSHYLAGFVYESLGEPSLAAPGYRTAIELRPGQGLLEDSLGGLEARLAAGEEGFCDVLFVIETGVIPGRASQSFNLPIPVGPQGRWIFISASFPVLPPAAPYMTPSVRIDKDLDVRTAHVLDLDAMARRTLKDEMPGIMLRAFIRLSSRAIAQYQMQEQIYRQQRKGQDTLGMSLGLLALQLGGMVTEQADERGWRTLPAHVTVARARLSRGQHSVEIDTGQGRASFDVNLAGRHALVTARLLGGRSFVTPAASPGMPSVPLPAGSKSAAAPGPIPVQVSVVNFDYPVVVSTSRRTSP